ncbi:transcription factor [Schizosaccharomyces cryophilus OY26]|uniref:Transcription factor n=1 Tax=Schizosaccharomyces cryophilus (strain OY26 / ATCC MYA-4695 / CBS 11777 / NBRC 106824 / NRRL Y48691) TaxID=653667 RepID=S9X8J5_SCHCR|nr:transcription factor [Schizosaccharomyces cryophilus OY26]EPY50151.1 transcription factor [Schizosaccharomyces cryophilus OY26]
MAEPAEKSSSSQQGKSNDSNNHEHTNLSDRTTQSLLNSYIYDYLVKKNYWEAAQAFGQEAQVQTLVRPFSKNSATSGKQTASSPANVKRESPNLNEPQNSESTKQVPSHTDIGRDPPPPPVLPIDSAGGFLIEWWNVFWDIYSARRGNGSEPAMAYMSHINNLRKKSYMNMQLLQKNLMQSGPPSNMYQVPTAPQMYNGDPVHHFDSSRTPHGNGMLMDRNRQQLMRQAVMNNQGRETFPPTAAQLQQLKQLHYRQLQSQKQQPENPNTTHIPPVFPTPASNPQSKTPPVMGPVPQDSFPSKQKTPAPEFRNYQTHGISDANPNAAAAVGASIPGQRLSQPLTPNSIPHPPAAFDSTLANPGNFMVPGNSAQPLLHEVNFQNNGTYHQRQFMPSYSNPPLPQNAPDKSQVLPQRPRVPVSQPNQYGFQPPPPYGQPMLYGMNAPSAPNNVNPALKNYMEELKLLEQQNKKRLLMVRQEKEHRMYQSTSPENRSFPAHPDINSGAAFNVIPKTNEKQLENTASENVMTSSDAASMGAINRPIASEQRASPYCSEKNMSINYTGLVASPADSAMHSPDINSALSRSGRPTPYRESPTGIKTKRRRQSNTPTTDSPIVNAVQKDDRSELQSVPAVPSVDPSMKNINFQDNGVSMQNDQQFQGNISSTKEAGQNKSSIPGSGNNMENPPNVPVLDAPGSTDLDAALLNDFDFDKFLKDTSTTDDIGFGLFNMPDNADQTTS